MQQTLFLWNVGDGFPVPNGANKKLGGRETRPLRVRQESGS